MDVTSPSVSAWGKSVTAREQVAENPLVWRRDRLFYQRKEGKKQLQWVLLFASPKKDHTEPARTSGGKKEEENPFTLLKRNMISKVEDGEETAPEKRALTLLQKKEGILTYSRVPREENQAGQPSTGEGRQRERRAFIFRGGKRGKKNK